MALVYDVKTQNSLYEVRCRRVLLGMGQEWTISIKGVLYAIEYLLPLNSPIKSKPDFLRVKQNPSEFALAVKSGDIIPAKNIGGPSDFVEAIIIAKRGEEYSNTSKIVHIKQK